MIGRHAIYSTFEALRERQCLVICPDGYRYECTREKGHAGEHHAHYSDGEPCKGINSWENEAVPVPTPSPSPSPSQPTTAREVLDIIDNFFASGGGYPGGKEQEHLWAVLTALRGPDEAQGSMLGMAYEVKHHTTVPIRTAALPATAKAVATGRVYIPADFDSATFTLPPAKGMSDHFYRHVKKAAESLKAMGLLVIRHPVPVKDYTIAELETLVQELKAKEEGK